MTTEATEAYLKKFEKLSGPRSMTNEATEAYLKKFEKLGPDEDTGAIHAALEEDVARVCSECNEDHLRQQAAREKRAAARAAREAAKAGLFGDATNREHPSVQSKDGRIAAERAIAAEQARQQAELTRQQAEQARQQAELTRPPAKEAPHQARQQSCNQESSARLRVVPIGAVRHSHNSSARTTVTGSAGRRAMRAMGRSLGS